MLWIILSTSALAAIQLSFALWLDFSPMVGVVGMGMCYSVCASALWPCISIVVEEKRLGMAYGLMTAFQNLGMALFPIIISPLLPDADRNSENTSMDEFIDMYRDVLMVFGSLASAATGFSVLLLLADLREGGWLNASAAALQTRDILRARRRGESFSTVPALYTHHVHSRNKYLSRLGIRPLGCPRLQNEVLDRRPGCLSGPTNLGSSDYDPSLSSVLCPLPSPPPPPCLGATIFWHSVVLAANHKRWRTPVALPSLFCSPCAVSTRRDASHAMGRDWRERGIACA